MRANKYKITMTPFEICNSVILLIIAILIFMSVMWMGGILVGYGGLSSDVYYNKYKPVIIVSESMTPTIEVNSLLLLEKKDYNDLDIDDIIMFKTRAYGLVTHRIIDKADGGFITKGDNNELVDNWVVTEDMYKGTVSSIHNEVSTFITILFGNLNELNIWKVLFGFIILFVLILWFILFVKGVYDYICVYIFLKISSKKGKENVIKEYYPYLEDNISVQEITEVFDYIGKEKGLFTHLRVRYKIMKLHNSLLHSERVKCKIYNRYNGIRKEFEK